MSTSRTLVLTSDDGNRIRAAARALLAFGLVLLLTLALGPLASAQEVTVQVADSPTLGKILTDGNGMTLYLFTKDTANVTNCYDQCAVNWPPLLVGEGEEPAAGPGLTGKLGTIDRTDGSRQVTYNGIPLYLWIKDTKAGDVTGQGVGDVWFVVHPDISSMTVASPVVQVSAHPSLGNILTNQGMTLYLFTKDTMNVTNCYDQCAVNWPPLLTNGGEPVAGTGLTGKLGVTDRTDGTKQVTYNGIPLYFWIKDLVPGDATGEGVGGVWYVLGPDTDAFPASASAPAAAATPASATTPSTLPVTGGSPLPWPAILAMAAGAVLLLGGLGLNAIRRTR